MISIDKALLRQLLLIEQPWEVRDYQMDVRKRRCDVWIAQAAEKGWFGRPRKATAPAPESTWQHLALGSVKFFVHVAIPQGTDLGSPQWAGDAGLPFTRALSGRVFALFNEGVSLQSVCLLMDLSLQDVWRYRYALDTGRAGAQGTGQPRQEARSDATPASAQQAERAAQPTPPMPMVGPSSPLVAEAANDSPNVPDVTDPVWLRLLDGDMSLDIRVLSLKLMLTRVRSQLDLISDEDVRMLKLKELHRYFVKNERVLTHELSQLRVG